MFPCEPGGKRPLTYNGFWDASTDPHRIETWWHRWPDANVGIPTGERSGLLVLDVDSKSGGPESLAALERVHGPFPKTTKVRTGGGGMHFFFGYPAGEEVRNSAGKLGPGLDVRGGGWIRRRAAEPHARRLRMAREDDSCGSGVALDMPEGAAVPIGRREVVLIGPADQS